MDLSLRQLARALGGEVRGRQVAAPGPNHSRKDRSLSVTLSATSPDGILVYSHAGDDWRLCRDYVRERCGLGGFTTRSRRRDISDHWAATTPSDAERIRRARKLWADGVDPRGTLASIYLASRALDLPDDIAGEALRFHPACPWAGENGLEFHPAMIAAMRRVDTDEIVGAHRTILSSTREKLGRRMLGQASGTAIKLDANENVEQGLVIGEGLETCMAARQIGYRPVWALGSIAAIAAFPVSPGIMALTVLTENDDASARGVEQCAERWHASGREVVLVGPTVGSDLNDVVKGPS